MQSQNSGKFASVKKGVKHNPNELNSGQLSSEHSQARVKDPKDSEAPSNLLDDRTQEDPGENMDDTAGEEDDLKFVLCSERYLIGRDIRGIV